MKKIFTLAFCAAAVMSAVAEDFTVYQNGKLTDGLAFYGWWNNATDFAAVNPDGEDQVMSFKAANGGDAASFGIFAPGASASIYTTPLNVATLTFDWYAEGTGNYAIRLTADGGKEEDYNFSVTADNQNKWNHESLVVSEVFPAVAEEWSEYVGKGAGYVFSIVLSNGTAESVLYVNNVIYTGIDADWKAPEVVVYEDPTTVPEPTQAAEDVISVFGSYYPAATSFNIGNWGQSTTFDVIEIDGKQVAKLTNFNYLGWELNQHLDITGYDYMHVDFFTYEGEAFGFTPISPGQEKAWIASEINKEEWNSYDVPLSYYSNVNFSDIFQIKFDQGSKYDAYITNVYFWKDPNKIPDEPVDPVTPGAKYTGTIESSHSQDMGEGAKEYPYTIEYAITYNEDETLTVVANFVWSDGEPIGLTPGSVFINNELNDFTIANGIRTATTVTTYTANEVIPINFYLPCALGVVQNEIMYTVGSSNTTSVELINNDSTSTPVYYNLSGVRVNNPANGLYIKVVDGKATKVRL